MLLVVCGIRAEFRFYFSTESHVKEDVWYSAGETFITPLSLFPLSCLRCPPICEPVTAHRNFFYSAVKLQYYQRVPLRCATVCIGICNIAVLQWM